MQWSCNAVEDPFDKIRVPNKMKHKNLKVFNMMKVINESNALAKQILCKCRCEFDGRKRNSRQNWKIDKSQ